MRFILLTLLVFSTALTPAWAINTDDSGARLIVSRQRRYLCLIALGAALVLTGPIRCGALAVTSVRKAIDSMPDEPPPPEPEVKKPKPVVINGLNPAPEAPPVVMVPPPAFAPAAAKVIAESKDLKEIFGLLMENGHPATKRSLDNSVTLNFDKSKIEVTLLGYGKLTLPWRGPVSLEASDLDGVRYVKLTTKDGYVHFAFDQGSVTKVTAYKNPLLVERRENYKLWYSRTR